MIKHWVVENDMIRLTDTKQTFLRNWIVKRPSINDFPSHIKLLILIFYLPNIITESGCLIGIRTVDDHAMVLHKTSFEVIGHANICLSFSIIHCDSCLVHTVVDFTIPVKASWYGGAAASNTSLFILY